MIELVAVVLRVRDTLEVLSSQTPPQLPSGPLRDDHDSLQKATRAFATEQMGHELGFVEQLYTFADLGRGSSTQRLISISYLGLTRPGGGGTWQTVYDALPWEDHRDPASKGVVAELVDVLLAWAHMEAPQQARAERVAHAFGLDPHPWRPDLALQRYELLWEAGLVAESRRRDPRLGGGPIDTGQEMALDHRRMLATALSRLRAKIEYAPVVADLMPPEFTLGALQDVVETIAGQNVHKQNFRRQVQQDRLVEATDRTTGTGGRPAQMYRFRRDVVENLRQVGTKAPIPRSR